LKPGPLGASGFSRLGADALLLVTAFLWGVTFVVQKYAVADLPPLAFVAARFGVSALALAPFALAEQRRASGRLVGREWRLALLMGAALFLAAALQQAGLATTSATNGGFLTACYVVLTPFAVWALSRSRPRLAVLRRALSPFSALASLRPAEGLRSRPASATAWCSSRISAGPPASR
jgi:drug/metabolite transporter (DMT)-like permease